MNEKTDEHGTLALIRQLVIAIGSTDEPVYFLSSNEGEPVSEPTWLAYYFKDAMAWEGHYKQALGRCDYLDAFWTACSDIVLDFSPVGITAYDEDLDRYYSTEETFNLLAQHIRANLALFSVPLPARGLSTLLCKLEIAIPVLGSILSASIVELAGRSRLPAP